MIQKFYLLIVCASLAFGFGTPLIAGPIMESGKINLGATTSGQTSFQWVAFDQAYDVAPVVVATPSDEGSDPVSLRIQGVTKEGFFISQVEPRNLDGTHAAMQVTYLAATPGRYQLASGEIFEAGTVETNQGVSKNGPNNYDTVNLQSTFSSAPAVLTQIQTLNNETAAVPGDASDPWMTTSVIGLGASSFQVSLDQAETGTAGSFTNNETIGYIAFSTTNSGTVGATPYTSQLTGAVVDGWTQSGTVVSLNTTFANDSDVVVLASQVTRNGADGSWIRAGVPVTTTTTDVLLLAEEDTFLDTERNHAAEDVAVVAFGDSFAFSSAGSGDKFWDNGSEISSGAVNPPYPGSELWHDNVNWRDNNTDPQTALPNNMLPTTTDRVYIALKNTGVAVPARVVAGDDLEVNNLVVGANPGLGVGGDGELFIEGGELRIRDNGGNGVGGQLEFGFNNRRGDVVITGGTLDVAGNIITAPGGNAQLYVDGGQLIVGGNLINVQSFRVGNGAGSNGTFTLQSGQTLDNFGGGVVGGDGTGNMTIASLATANIATDAFIGWHTGGNGTLTIEEAGQYNVGDSTFIGFTGDAVGEVNVLGSLTSANGLFLGGDSANSSQTANTATMGTLNVGGPGNSTASVLVSSGNFEIGRQGTGVVNQISGSVTSQGGNLVLGQFSDSVGTYNMMGGTLDVQNDLNFNRGVGTFNHDGGHVIIGRNLQLGVNASTNPAQLATYNLRIDPLDPNSSMTLNGNLYVGRDTNALFNHESGDLTTNNVVFIGGDTTGSEPNANGEYILGTGTTSPNLTVINSNLEVGRGQNANGEFQHNSGNVMVTGGNLVLAQANNSNGLYTHDGGDILLRQGSGSTSVGKLNLNSGNGTFIQNAGLLSAETGIQLGNNGTIGNHLMEINGGRVETLNGDFIVGRDNTARVVQTGGVVEVMSAGTELILSQNGSGNGTYELQGGDLILAGDLNFNNGTGVFDQSGGNAFVAGDINLASGSGNSTLLLSGGLLDLQGSDTGNGDVNFRAGTASVQFTGGTLRDMNTFGSDLVQTGGTLEVGDEDLEARVTSVLGGYSLGVSALLDIDAYTLDENDVDMLIADAAVNLDGTIDFDLNGIDGTQKFQWWNVVKTPDQLLLGADFSVNGGIYRTVNVDGINILQIGVPEPTSLLAWSLAIGGLALLRRRRRHGMTASRKS